MKEKIEKIVDEAKQLYCLQTQRQYLEDKKKEINLKKQYKGREIYELLQNIDDAASEDKKCIASISLQGDSLRISNNGIPFNISTLQRLCQGAVSEKDDKYIGCKGIGFRSVLNWSNEVCIYSGWDKEYVSVKFSYDYAKETYNTLIKDRLIKSHIENQKNELLNKGYDTTYPIFKAPQYINPIKKYFDTVIELKIKEEARENIKESLKKIDEHILLFLPNLKEINIDIDGEVISFQKSEISENRIGITKNNNTTDEYIFCKEESKLSKKVFGSDKLNIAVAIPIDENYLCSETPYIYTFFPVLGLKSPFPAFLHATLLLTDNRNDLDFSTIETKDANIEIFNKLLNFYIATVIKNLENENRLKLLMPFSIPTNLNDEFKFNDSIGKLGIESNFINNCKDIDLFYSVKPSYIKGRESPIILDSFPLSDVFRGENFDKVVKFISDEKLRGFAKRIADNNNDIEKYLYDAINKLSDKWDVHTRTKTFKWWNSQGYTKLPRLLKTINGNFLVKKEEPCFLSNEDTHEWVKEIPTWANISVLSNEDLHALIKAYENEINKEKKPSESNKRVLPRLINKDLVDIQEQSSKQVLISPINSSIKNHEQATQFINWLWKVWNEASFEESIKKINFKVPTNDEGYEDSNKVFLGREYFNNDIGETIFENLSGYKKIGMNIDGNYESVKEFFNEIGVLLFPNVQVIEKNQISEDSLEYKFITQLIKKDPLMESQDNIHYYNTSFYSINNIETLLKKLETIKIIEWIYTDSILRNAIENDAQPKGAYIKYLQKFKHKPSTHNNGWLLPSYLRFVFSNTKWIEINDKRYSPNELIITNNDLLEFGLTGCLSESRIDDYATDKYSKEELRKLFITLGAKTSYLELDSEIFYALLLNLGESGDNNIQAKKISKEIYRNLIDNTLNVSNFEDSENKKRFFNEGKVLVKKDGISCFVEKNKAFFSSSAVVNFPDEYPIDVPARRGKKEDFEKILGIKQYEINYKVKEVKESKCNDQFQNDLASFIPCIMCYRNGKKDEVVNLSIELVESVNITYENKIETINSRYTLLKQSNKHWFICIGNETEYQNLAKEQIAESLVQIFNVLFNFPSKDFLIRVQHLFICNHKQREYLIESEFGGKEEIENIKQEIKSTSEFYNNISTLFQDVPNSSVKVIASV